MSGRCPLSVESGHASLRFTCPLWPEAGADDCIVFTHTSFASDGLSGHKSSKIGRVDLFWHNDVTCKKSFGEARVDSVRVRLCDAGHFGDLGDAFVPGGGFICQRFCRADIVGPRSSSAAQALSIRQSRARLRALFIKQSRRRRATDCRSSSSGRVKTVRLHPWPTCGARKPLRFPTRTPAAILSAIASELATRIVSIVDIQRAFFNVYRSHALTRARARTLCVRRKPGRTIRSQ